MRSSDRRLGGAVGCLLSVLLVAACGSSPYTRVQRAWTESQRYYQDFETRAILHATLKSPAFRQAWREEYAAIYALDADQRAALQEADEAEQAEHITVIASFYTQEHRWNTLNPRDGIWEVRLEDRAGDFARPVRVKRLDTTNPVWQRLYPFHDPFSILYELQFEKQGVRGGALMREGNALTLVVASAPATLRLTWELR